MNTAIFLPSGGSRRLRRRFVDALGIEPGDSVLELGCGTGQVTVELVAAGAVVVAVDALPDMLAAARRRAPTASFIHDDALEADAGDGYDHVVIAFVLHNFDATGRADLLRRAGEALGPNGRIGVLDWAEPTGRARAALWRRFLAALEPAPTVTEVLDGAFIADAEAAGLAVDQRHRVAGGRAEVLVFRPKA